MEIIKQITPYTMLLIIIYFYGLITGYTIGRFVKKILAPRKDGA